MKRIIATSIAILVLAALGITYLVSQKKSQKKDIPEMETGMPQTMQMPPAGQSGRNVGAFDSNIKVTPAEGGFTISQIFVDRNELKGKTIKVRGQVVKVVREVMDRNWVHIQDGTNGDGEYDLTITTLDSVAKGEVVTFEGTLNLNRDFGAGYVYSVILEDSRLLKN